MSRRRAKNYSVSIAIKKIIYYAFLFLLLYLGIVFSEKNHSKFEEFRTKLLGSTSFFLKLVSVPFLPIQALQGNNDFSIEKNELEKTFLEINIRRENLIISDLTNLQKTILDINLETYRLIFIAPQYYSSSGFLTDVIFNSSKIPEEDLSQIKPNMAIISEKALYGRVSAISGSKISIISIFNILSRVPIYTKISKVYGVASGNGSEIFFTYPAEHASLLLEGEEVFTSGENDLFIANIPVGKINKINGKYLVVPYSKTRPIILGIINKI